MTLTKISATQILTKTLLWGLLAFPICCINFPIFGEGEKYFLRFLLPTALLLIAFSWNKNRVIYQQNFSSFFKIWCPWIFAAICLSAYHKGGGFSAYITLPVASVFIYACTKDILKFDRTLLYLVCSCSSIVIFSLQAYQVWYLGIHRGGLGLNAVIFAHVCTFFVGISLYGIWDCFTQRKTTVTNTAIIFIGSLFGLGVILLSETRGALLAIVCLCIFLLIKSILTKNKKLCWALSALGMTMIAISAPVLAQGIRGLIETIQHNSVSSWGIRLELWSVSLQALELKPFLGWGKDALASIHQHTDLANHLATTFRVDIDFHNDVFNILATGGLFWLAAYIYTMYKACTFTKTDHLSLWIVINMIVLGWTNCAFAGNRAVIVAFLISLILANVSSTSSDHLELVE